MKKILANLLAICLMLSAGGALAQSAGNLNNGGFIESDAETLYYAREDGIYGVTGERATKIADGRASALQLYEGRLYFLRNTYGADEDGYITLMSQIPMSCLPDGSDARVLGESKRVGDDYDFGEAGYLRSDSYIGYRDFTVANGYLYYLANSQEGGEYECVGVWEISDTQTETEVKRAVFENGIALYRSDLDGANVTKLTGVLGNSVAHMAIADGKIAVGAGYRDAVYAYNFVNYMVYDLNGELITAYHNEQPYERSLFSDAGEFYHILECVQLDEQGMLVSLSDSEGDFIASQLYRLTPDGALSRMVIEQRYVPSIVDGDTIYYVGSESPSVFYDYDYDYNATHGIYKKALTDEGMGEKLVALPYSEYMNDFGLSVLGGTVYFHGADLALFRVNAEGELEGLTDAGFEAAAIDFQPGQE